MNLNIAVYVILPLILENSVRGKTKIDCIWDKFLFIIIISSTQKFIKSDYLEVTENLDFV